MEKLVARLKERYGAKRSFQFISELVFRCRDDRIGEVGAQLAYYLVFSFFPFIIFLLSLLTFTQLGQEDVLRRLVGFLPQSTADLIEPILLDVLASRSTAVLSTSLLLALWSGSNGISNLLKAMDTAFDIVNQRKAVLKRILAVVYTLLLAIVIILVLALQVFGDSIVHQLAGQLYLSETLLAVWDVIKLLLPLALTAFGFSFLYKFGPGFPANHRITFREALVGGVFTAIGWTLFSLLFRVYVANFGNYANTYGSLGGLIVLLLWLFLSSVMIMFGAEVAATYVSVYKGGLRQKSPQAQEMSAEVLAAEQDEAAKSGRTAEVAEKDRQRAERAAETRSQIDSEKSDLRAAKGEEAVRADAAQRGEGEGYVFAADPVIGGPVEADAAGDAPASIRKVVLPERESLMEAPETAVRRRYSGPAAALGMIGLAVGSWLFWRNIRKP